MRNIELLQPDVQNLVKKLKYRAAKKKIKFVVTSTVRTDEEQKALWSMGRHPLHIVNKLRASALMTGIDDQRNVVVTWDSGNDHADGACFDIFVISPYTMDWDEKCDPAMLQSKDYEIVASIAEDLGLIWGARTEKLNRGHFSYGQAVPSNIQAGS